MDRSSLIASLLSLRREQRSGVLEIRADGTRSFFYLLQGELVFAEEESTGETLGRLLVRQNKLTQKQYAHVIDRMTSAIIDNEQLRFGEVAVELGYLTAEEAQRALADQVRWKIIRALQREEHETEFSESFGQVDGVAQFTLPLEPLILEACRWVPDERKQATLAQIAPDRLLTLREPAPVAALRYQTTPEERAFLTHLDGRKRLGELLAIAKASDADVPALLTALVVSSGLAYAREPAPMAPPPTPPQAFVPPPAPPAAPAVHRAAVPTPAQFVPFKGPAPDTKQQKDAAKEKADRALALLRAQRAGTAAAPPPTPAPAVALSQHEARLTAEQAFQRGRTYLAQGQHRQALGELDKAHKLQPDAPEYALYASWAAFIVGTANPDEGKARLRQQVTAATKADPNSAFAYYVLGELSLLDKNEPAAKRAFSHALKLDPDLLDARRRLRLLNKK